MADLFRQSIGMKNLKYTKYSCVFHTSTCQKISRRPLLLIESELPDTLLFRGAAWDKCKMESGKFPAARCRGGACPSQRNAADWYRLPIKTRKPIASVAALTAQPLAALPPYGCGVPLAGSERLVEEHSTVEVLWCTTAPP